MKTQCVLCEVQTVYVGLQHKAHYVRSARYNTANRTTNSVLQMTERKLTDANYVVSFNRSTHLYRLPHLTVRLRGTNKW
jgi:hypothetical protein